MTWVIVATLLSPLSGLFSVYFPVKTNRALAANDYSGARENSLIARKWAQAVFWPTAAVLLLLFGGIFFLTAPI